MVQNFVTEANKESQQFISGIAVLDDDLFTVHKDQKGFEVYSFSSEDSKFIFKRSCDVKGLLNPVDIASCKDNKLLYIVNKDKQKVTKIIKVNPSGEAKGQWETSEAICQLSVAKEHVIAACKKSSIVFEYNCEGKLIRNITVSKGANVKNLHKIIALHSGYFVFSHGKKGDEAHRICIIGDHGKLLKAFGSKLGCSEGQMNLPGHLVIDGDDSVIVADTGNQRVLLLTPQLDFKRELLKKEHGLVNPLKVCLDTKRGFLIVADNICQKQKDKAEGRIRVYSVMQTEVIYARQI